MDISEPPAAEKWHEGMHEQASDDVLGYTSVHRTCF